MGWIAFFAIMLDAIGILRSFRLIVELLAICIAPAGLFLVPRGRPAGAEPAKGTVRWAWHARPERGSDTMIVDSGRQGGWCPI